MWLMFTHPIGLFHFNPLQLFFLFARPISRGISFVDSETFSQEKFKNKLLIFSFRDCVWKKGYKLKMMISPQKKRNERRSIWKQFEMRILFSWWQKNKQTHISLIWWAHRLFDRRNKNEWANMPYGISTKKKKNHQTLDEQTQQLIERNQK